MLEPEGRVAFTNFSYLVVTYKLQLMVECLAIFLMLCRTIQILRVNREFHLIGVVIDHSGDLMILFLTVNIILITVLVPFAMGLWGIFIPAYSSGGRAYSSILMIMFAKGNFDELSLFNPYFTFVFLLIYYSMIVFIMHAAFHKI